MGEQAVTMTTKQIRKSLSRWRKLHEEKWGIEGSREKWLNNIVEECAELIQAVQHYRRKRVPFSVVRTEMADVTICTDMILNIEDGSGEPIVDDVGRITQYQIDILEGVTPQIHNDGEENPPLPVEEDVVK